MELLKSADDWSAYITKQLGPCDARSVEAPREFPCLAAVAWVGERPLTCFAYSEDAHQLLRAADPQTILSMFLQAARRSRRTTARNVTEESLDRQVRALLDEVSDDAPVALTDPEPVAVSGTADLNRLLVQLQNQAPSVVKQLLSPKPLRAAVVASDQGDFQRRVAAFIFTFMDVCVPPDKQADFERRFVAHLSAVDQMHSERAQAIRSAIDGFDMLFPGKDSEHEST